MERKLVILLLGKSGRLDAMAAAIKKSPRTLRLYILSEVGNPSLEAHATEVYVGDSADPDLVVAYAKLINPDFAVIGPEEPLAAGVVDALAGIGVPSVGPCKELAKIESSKSFARDLIARHGIGGNPLHRTFHNKDGLSSYMEELGEFVIKPDGLTGGKGVRVWGDHFYTISEAEAYCAEIFSKNGIAIIEEKLEGEEFSFQSFCDGETVKDTIPVQDHKRLGNGDTGPNTGGMGSYTCANHLLPFLTHDDILQASRINSAVAHALKKEFNKPYKGILYGGFMLTRKGLRVIEYNARFGDPEALNILPILETDFVDICEAIIEGTLKSVNLKFAAKATVCKYVVPQGYPQAGVSEAKVAIPFGETENLRIYMGAIKTSPEGDLLLTGSRAIGLVGIADTLEEAERVAEEAACQITGPVFHRSDVGTQELVQSRVEHMRAVRSSPDSHPHNGHGARRWA